MIQKGMTDYFDSLTLYPSRNTHFHSSDGHIGSIEAYKELLTDKGRETFHAVTYKVFFNVLKEHYKNDRNVSWLDYIEERYNNTIY